MRVQYIASDSYAGGITGTRVIGKTLRGFRAPSWECLVETLRAMGYHVEARIEYVDDSAHYYATVTR
jgi:hypothetical protein